MIVYYSIHDIRFNSDEKRDDDGSGFRECDFCVRVEMRAHKQGESWGELGGKGLNARFKLFSMPFYHRISPTQDPPMTG